MKSVEEIYAQLLADHERHTGLRPKEGTDLSARLYALAAQLYSLYIQSDWVSRQAFPQTAEGTYLDYHAQLRGLERKPAVAARGEVRFTAGESAELPREIPEGTVCMTAGMVRFETTAPAVLPAGGLTVDVPVRALEAGAAGNVAAGDISAMAVAPMGISGCTNPDPCVGGYDGEGDEALRERVLETFRRLPNGANAAFYQQGALSFDEVAAAAVIPRPRGKGTVDVIPATLAGVPDQGLLERLEDYFKARREIAVDVQVRAPETVGVSVSVRVRAEGGWDSQQVLAQVRQAIQSWFNGKLLGRDILLAQLGHLIYSCEGVENYAILSPAADLAIQKDELPVLNALTVEAMT